MSNDEAKGRSARATVAMLCERWPKCFDLNNRRPLKIGIAHDLVRELGDTVSQSELKGALNLYCGHLVYLSTRTAGTSRLDVGIVSREDELRAAARLKAVKTAKAKARTPVTEEKAPHQTVRPPLSAPPVKSAKPARLGFEALRRPCGNAGQEAKYSMAIKRKRDRANPAALFYGLKLFVSQSTAILPQVGAAGKVVKGPGFRAGAFH